jgi:hypothetical protein
MQSTHAPPVRAPSRPTVSETVVRLKRALVRDAVSGNLGLRPTLSSNLKIG